MGAVGRHAKDLEQKYGIPTVAAAGANVVKFGIDHNFKYNTGIPTRYVAFPFPFAGQPKAVLDAYVDGKDKLSGKPMMQAIIDGLTKPLNAEEKISGVPPDARPDARILPPDTEDNLQRLFKEKDWTDYNPIILPTEERVARMLQGTSHKPDEVVKTLSGARGNRPFTVEKVSVIAVMAGARPEYFPLILAIASQVPYGGSTTSITNMMVINGPIRKEIGMNTGLGALGPHNEANAVIGRVMTLINKTIGDYHLGSTAFTSMSNNLQYNNMCIPENEEALPEGWLPLHVQMGFKPSDSVVTIFTGWSTISSSGWVEQHYAPQLLMRDYMRSLSANHGGSATMIMDPSTADLLKTAQGFNTKEMLSEWLSQNVEKTAASYWGNAIVSSMTGPLALQGLEPYATWRRVPGDTLIKPFSNPKNIQTVVVGGRTASVWFATDFRARRGASVDEWR